MNRPRRSMVASWASAIGRRGGIVALGLFLASCGTTELEVDETFDNTWQVTELIAEGETIELAGQRVEIEIDTGQAAIRGRTNCQALFGSYTLVDDGGDGGEASFTIPSPAAGDDCGRADQLVHSELVEALESVTRWERASSTLTLSSPTGSMLTLETLNPDG